MKTMLISVLLLTSCSKPRHYGPDPQWKEASGFWTYGHWECPADWHTQLDERRRTVICEADLAQNKRMEQYEKSFQPERTR